MDFAKVLVTIWYWKNVCLAEQLIVAASAVNKTQNIAARAVCSNIVMSLDNFLSTTYCLF